MLVRVKEKVKTSLEAVVREVRLRYEETVIRAEVSATTFHCEQCK